MHPFLAVDIVTNGNTLWTDCSCYNEFDVTLSINQENKMLQRNPLSILRTKNLVAQ